MTDAWAAFGQIAYELFKFLEKSASPLLAGIQRWGQILLAIAPPLAVKSYFVGISAESANNEEVLLQGMSEFLIEISRTHPLGIFIDNMEWLDHSSLGLLNRLLAMSQDHPIFICGTYRGAGQQSSFEKLVPRLLAKKSCEEIVLERLSKQEIEAMLGSMIGKEEIQADVLDKIAEVSRGIPLLAEETIKNMSSSVELKLRGVIVIGGPHRTHNSNVVDTAADVWPPIADRDAAFSTSLKSNLCWIQRRH